MNPQESNEHTICNNIEDTLGEMNHKKVKYYLIPPTQAIVMVKLKEADKWQMGLLG